jgi:hypothetical protein
MNPFDLSASDLLVWGIVLHLIADWPLQNDWMANNKTNLLHPAGYVHAGIHGILLAFVFGWVAIPLAVVHLLIDTRVPVVWWSRLIRQTQPRNPRYDNGDEIITLMDPGMEVRFWTDQVFHIFCVAVVAILVSL